MSITMQAVYKAEGFCSGYSILLMLILVEQQNLASRYTTSLFLSNSKSLCQVKKLLTGESKHEHTGILNYEL